MRFIILPYTLYQYQSSFFNCIRKVLGTCLNINLGFFEKVLKPSFPRSYEYGAQWRIPPSPPPVPLQGHSTFDFSGDLKPQTPFLEHIVPRL